MKQKRGVWTVFEDRILIDYINAYGEGHWSKIPINTGLKRSAKSCRFRWLNYLKPDIKRGNITKPEEDLIIRMHKLLGNRWSLIAGRLPGRTDNEIKNYWNTVLSKKVEGCHSIIPTKNKKTKEAASHIIEEAVSPFNDAMINIWEEQRPKCDCTHKYNVDGTPSAGAKFPEGSEVHGDALASFSSTAGAENDDEFIWNFASIDVNKLFVSDFAELSDFKEWYHAQ